MLTMILAVAVVALAMTGLAIGYIVHGRCMRGTCGGQEVIAPDGETITCGTCGRERNDDHHDTAPRS